MSKRVFCFSVFFLQLWRNVQWPTRFLHWQRLFLHPIDGTEHGSPPSLTICDRKLVSTLKASIEHEVRIRDLWICHSTTGLIGRYLWITDSQFGFKAAHGTGKAIFALKQMVHFYHDQDTPVYLCFLRDTWVLPLCKQAFEPVNHWTLTNRLLERGGKSRVFVLGNFLSSGIECWNLWYAGQTQSHISLFKYGIMKGGQL